MALKYAAVGRCIYCHASDVPLSLEHVIPFGLSGDFELPQASCEACARATSAFEAYCLQKMLIHPRLKLNLKTRRPKKRPKTLTAGIFDKSGGFSPRDVDVEEYPITIALPQFGYPAALLGGEKTNGILCTGVGLHFNEKWQANQTLFGNGTAYYAPFEPSAFCKLLCKIALGFTVGECGSTDFDTQLPKAIVGRSGDECHFVGSDPFDYPAAEELHTVQLRNIGGWRVCSVRLFAKYGATPYLVVVGRA